LVVRTKVWLSPVGHGSSDWRLGVEPRGGRRGRGGKRSDVKARGWLVRLEVRSVPVRGVFFGAEVGACGHCRCPTGGRSVPSFTGKRGARAPCTEGESLIDLSTRQNRSAGGPAPPGPPSRGRSVVPDGRGPWRGPVEELKAPSLAPDQQFACTGPSWRSPSFFLHQVRSDKFPAVTVS